MVSEAVLECPTTDNLPDWNLAKALYVSGLQPKEIVRKANVPEAGLSKRITREGWNKLRSESRSILSATVTVTRQPVSETIKGDEGKSQERNAIIHKRLSERLEKLTGWWDTLKQPKSIVEHSAHLSLLNQATDIGKTLFGWGAGNGGSGMLRLEVMAACRPPDPMPIAQAIDVPSTTTPEQLPPEQVEGRP